MPEPPRIPAAPARAALGLVGGAGYLIRGIGFWGRRPGAMALGLLPAVLVAAVATAGLVALAVALDPLVGWATPFADGWDPTWRFLLRLTIQVVVFLGATVLAVVTFTAVTLVVGDPLYERVRRAVDAEAGGAVPEGSPSFGDLVLDALRAVGLGVVSALLVALAGFVPAIGGVLAAVLGAILGGAILGRELTGRALAARGLGPVERGRLARGRRAPLLGFGIAVQLCFLVPLGAVLVMPAAVAGGTLLARRMLGEPELPRRGQAAEPGAPSAPSAPSPSPPA
ncbi:MAG: EI24 domain-containing protein [Actinomycetales bacterium]|nr:EI24 domain-containing protein [Actinomycetales bacterium]